MEQIIDTKSQRLRWISHNGVKIFFGDLSDLDSKGYYDVLLEVQNVYEQQAPQSILTILDISNSFISKESQALQKKITKLGISRHAAVVGITGLKKILAQAVRTDLYWANSMEDAKDWIVKKDQGK